MTTTETRRMNASVAGIAVAWMMANTPSVATILAPSDGCSEWVEANRDVKPDKRN